MSVVRLPPSPVGAALPCQANHLLSPAPPMHLQRCQEWNGTCGVKESTQDGYRLDTGCVFVEAELLRLGGSGREGIGGFITLGWKGKEGGEE